MALMRLPRSSWESRKGLAALLAALDASEGRTRFVGGFVRDTLLGLPVSDVDLATSFEPAEIVERLKRARIKAVPTGIAHGTITAVVQQGPVQVTSLRRDVSTDGRRATVAFTDDWREDAARRDFTINALSAGPETGEVHDYFGGLEDLAERRVRFIGDPLRRIAEDHLRILRFFRFHARFGAGAPDPEALSACAARANDLMALSRERIADELLKLLSLEDPVPAVSLMEQLGLFAPILPEITADGIQPLRRLVDRERLLGLVGEPIRRLAALLPRDRDLARAVGARLKVSNEARSRLEEYARPADRLQDPRHLAYTFGKERAVSLMLLYDIDDAALQQAYSQLRDWDVPSFPLKGGDLIAMGLPKGPLVARTFQSVTKAWCEAGFPGEEAAREIARAAVDQALRSSQ